MSVSFCGSAKIELIAIERNVALGLWVTPKAQKIKRDQRDISAPRAKSSAVGATLLSGNG